MSLEIQLLIPYTKNVLDLRLVGQGVSEDKEMHRSLGSTLKSLKGSVACMKLNCIPSTQEGYPWFMRVFERAISQLTLAFDLDWECGSAIQLSKRQTVSIIGPRKPIQGAWAGNLCCQNGNG